MAVTVRGRLAAGGNTITVWERLLLMGITDDKENGICTTFYPNGAIAGRIWYLRGIPVSVKWLYDGQGLLQKRFSLDGLEK